MTTGILLGLEGTALRTEILEFEARGSERAEVRERRERAVRVERTGKYILKGVLLKEIREMETRLAL